MDWENLEEEKQERVLSGKVKLVIKSEGFKTISELANNSSPEEYYRNILLKLEKSGIVKYSE